MPLNAIYSSANSKISIPGQPPRYPDNPQWYECDKIFNDEAENHLRIRKDRIKRGNAPSWENHISYYEVAIPKEFGAHWRIIRNRRYHSDYRRASANHDITLTDFYSKYHRFIMLFLDWSKWLWNVEDVESFDWKEIQNFNKVITKST